jgi:NAD-dependent protein deacetylase/lipoamidase
MKTASGYSSIVVLTGAGVSAESGLATFRDSNGLWNNHRIEDVATPEAFVRNPKLVWEFYSARRLNALSVSSNAAHHALAAFSKSCSEKGVEFTLVTQNVDGLHEAAHLRAGAAMPLTMHGRVCESRCTRCEKVYPDEKIYKTGELPQSACCQKLLRPHIVWFGEMPLFIPEIERRLEACDLFVTIGTSGNVYPAAGFLMQARAAGATTVCLNKERILQDHYVDLHMEGPATKLVPEFFR